MADVINNEIYHLSPVTFQKRGKGIASIKTNLYILVAGYINNFCVLRFAFSLLLSLFLVKTGMAQFTSGQMKTELSLYSTVASEGYQPFWLTHNRWGIFDDESANGLLRFSSRKALNSDRFFDWGTGFSIVGRVSEHSTLYFHEGYLEAGLGILNIMAGRKMQVQGGSFLGLSSGSTGLSRNASPIPRVAFSIPEFQTIPGTAGWFEFKGHVSHGWFSDRRHARDLPEETAIGLKNTYLHEKSFYLRTGGNTGLKFYTGLLHFAEWGGLTENGRELPDSFDDFLKITVASRGGDDGTGIDQANALGAHYGIWDAGLTADIGNSRLFFTYQHLFSDRSGMLFRNLKDGLYGIGIKNPFQGDWINGILWEFLYTKHQTGPGLPDPMAGDSPSFCEEVNCGYRFNGRDDYYNNGYYLSGWSYHSRSLGNPMLLTRTYLNLKEANVETYNNRYFVSTRVVAHHAGLQGRLHDDLSWKFLVTWNRHYGTWFGLNLGEPWGSRDPSNNPEEYFFTPPVEQWYFLLETEYLIPGLENILLQSAFAVDSGDLFSNMGVLLGMKWKLSR